MTSTPEPPASTSAEPLEPIDPDTDDSDMVPTDPEVVADRETADEGRDGPSAIPVRDLPDDTPDEGETAGLTEG